MLDFELERFENLSNDFIRYTSTILYGEASRFFDKHKLLNKVYLDEGIFFICLRDFFADLNRIKPFHGIDNFSESKIYGYAAYWICRRKPFQLIENGNIGNIHVNEYFSLGLLVNAINLGYKVSKDTSKEEYPIRDRMIQECFYYLCYRNLNPQAIELFLNGINLGKESFNC